MLILASQSPRRAELLRKIYRKPFRIIPSALDEEKIKTADLLSLPEEIAYHKGLAVAAGNNQDAVLAADTIVIFRGRKFGKPRNYDEAYRMLTALNEKEHTVVTGYDIFDRGQLLSRKSVVTALVLHGLDDRKIREYIATQSPFDKAGGYGIQDSAYISYTIVSGEYDNVMGFPSAEIKAELERFSL